MNTKYAYLGAMELASKGLCPLVLWYILGAASNDNWPSLFRADMSGLPVCDGHQNNMLFCGRNLQNNRLHCGPKLQNDNLMGGA